jgi:dTDP-glucose 4,6-dehydratase
VEPGLLVPILSLFFLESNPDNAVVNLDLLTYAGDKANLRELENNNRYTFVEGDICN